MDCRVTETACVDKAEKIEASYISIKKAGAKKPL